MSRAVFRYVGFMYKSIVIIIHTHMHARTHAHTHTHTHTYTHTGLQHIPVGPLTPQQEKLANAAALMSSQPTATNMQRPDHHDQEDTPTQHGEGGVSGLSGAFAKVGGAKIKAFSGKGHTLSSAPVDMEGAKEGSARGGTPGRHKRRVDEGQKVS